MSVSQDDVVRAAVEVLDDHGLPGVTLRAVAARLGVSAPTLYWHVKSKRHLLDLMAEAIIAPVQRERSRPAPGQDVGDWLADRARAIRAALLAHRDGALVCAGNRPTAAAVPGIEAFLGVLVDHGFTAPEALRTVMALGAYVSGDALETQSDAARGLEEAPVDSEIAMEIRTGRYPVLQAAAEAFRSERAFDEARFEEGLQLLIAGMRARLAGRAPSDARP
jgi:TetR/AcrR family transcriptional regulator, tetracycline repressor protein